MDRSGKWSHPRILVAWLTVLAVAAGGLWFFLGPEANRDQAGCEELGRDARVRTALGEAHRPDMACEELGRAMKRAAVPGSSADGHTREAAAAMKNILLAVDDDIRRREQLGVDAALRRPLAESLASYADVNVMLTDPTDSVYVRESLFSRGPWEAEDGFHMAVNDDTLVRVIRAVSADPAAYAVVRQALTSWEAGRLAAFPAGSEALRWSVGARALGKLDGVADHVREGLSQDEAREWNAAVVRKLSAGTATREAAAPAAERIERAWQHALTRAPESERDAVVERQCAVMLDAAGLTAATDQCLSNASGTASRALRVLRAV
ncbi:hypothetical protein [Streptomyces sp. TRM75563]|uniref:hypothetical protein n=1 Tax=Streptomyces sp. TRM75563 TaxID=2817418 RepID=UPI001F61DABE|nr:hypothetical protein [Streptomyces sp. TRM75563]MCI4040660.1 hypothetical protein [Streptomyces sp. TRM75563]